MVGMPLLNLGTALGGLTQGYNQSQQQYMQRQLQQMALDQAQRQQLAARLAGLGGIGGLLGGGNRMPMMGQPAAAPPVMNPNQTFAPNNPNNPISAIPPPSQQQPPDAAPWGAGTRFGKWNQTDDTLPVALPDPSLAPGLGFGTGDDGQQSSLSPYGQQIAAGMARAGTARGGQFAGPGATDAQGSTSSESIKSYSGPDTAGTYIVTMADGTQKQMTQDEFDTARQTVPSTSPVTKPTPLPRVPAQDDPGRPQATTTSDASGGTGGGGNVQVTTGAGHTTDVSDLFRTIDPTALFQGLARLAPKGTDPGVIYEAASDLIKLSNGDKSAQLQAAYLGKALGVDIANIRAGATTQAAQIGAGARVQSAEIGAGARVQSAEIAAAAKRDIAAASQDLRRQLADTTNKRLTAKDQMGFVTTTQRLAIAAHNAGRADLAAQLSAINAQIRSIRPADGSTLDETQQAQLKQLTQEAARIGQLLATMPSVPMQAPVLAPQQ